MNANSTVKLNNGVEMPLLGFGTFEIKEVEPILWALEAEYRHLDTATRYENEEIVGEAIKKSGIPREKIFITTKLQHSDMDDPQKMLNESLKKLGIDYVDLYLIHWPMTGKSLPAWKIIEELYREGKAKAIGVSNFEIKHLKELLEVAEVVPAVNQIEFHVYLAQKELREFCKEKGIQFECYRPLTKGRNIVDERIEYIAKKYSKTIPQIMLKWVIQKGIPLIPRSSKKERIFENANIFDFELSEEDVKELDSLNEDKTYMAGPPEGVN